MRLGTVLGVVAAALVATAAAGPFGRYHQYLALLVRGDPDHFQPPPDLPARSHFVIKKSYFRKHREVIQGLIDSHPDPKDPPDDGEIKRATQELENFKRDVIEAERQKHVPKLLEQLESKLRRLAQLRGYRQLTGLAAKARESDIEKVKQLVREIRQRLRAAGAEPPETEIERAEQAMKAQGNGHGEPTSNRRDQFSLETSPPPAWQELEKKQGMDDNVKFWAGQVGQSLERYVGGHRASTTAAGVGNPRPGFRKPAFVLGH